MSIDTDERATPEFAAEVRETLVQPKFDAYHVPRRNTFLGKPVRFGGMYPDYRQPQVFDRRKLRYRDDLVHEGFDCDGTHRILPQFHLAASLAHAGGGRQKNRPLHRADGPEKI